MQTTASLLFTNKADALDAAKESAKLTRSRYFNDDSYEPEKTKDGYKATLESLGYKFTPFQMNLPQPNLLEDLDTHNGVPMLYALVQDNRIVSIHSAEKKARKALEDLRKEVVEKRRKAKHGD